MEIRTKEVVFFGAIGLIFVAVAMATYVNQPHYAITQTPLPRATSVATAVVPAETPVRHPGLYSRAAPELRLPMNDLDVVKLLGKPTSTQSLSADGSEYWYYSGVTYDPVTDKPDSQVQFVIHDRIVTAINFY